jgi:hypothetical protein
VVNAQPNDRDQRLLELLAELETIGQRDQAIRGLSQAINATLSGSYGQQPLVGLTQTHMRDPSMQMPLHFPETQPELSPAPAWQNHALTMVPVEYQSMAATAMQHATKRTLIIGAISALTIGAYTGHVNIPPALRNFIQASTPAGNCPEVITYAKTP